MPQCTAMHAGCRKECRILLPLPSSTFEKLLASTTNEGNDEDGDSGSGSSRITNRVVAAATVASVGEISYEVCWLTRATSRKKYSMSRTPDCNSSRKGYRLLEKSAKLLTNMVYAQRRTKFVYLTRDVYVIAVR